MAIEDKIPQWGECYKAVQEGIATALQVFIYNNEPAGGEQDKEFREQLQALITEEQEERVCRNCLKPYQSHSLCYVCETKITDDAFDKGFETGKEERAILDVEEQRPLVEALKEAEEKLKDKLRGEAFAWGASPERANEFANTYPTIAKIDKALEGR